MIDYSKDIIAQMKAARDEIQRRADYIIAKEDLMTYFDHCSKRFSNKIIELKPYKQKWKSSKSQQEFYEFLGLTKSLYELRINEPNKFFNLMSHWWTLSRNPKLKFIDGIPYRTRRGKLVKLNLDWVGHFPSKYTMRTRKSKLTNKCRRSRIRTNTLSSHYTKIFNSCKNNI